MNSEEEDSPGRGNGIGEKSLWSGRAGGWIPRWHKHTMRGTEVERPLGKIIGAQLAMTESELNPELEGNGPGK